MQVHSKIETAVREWRIQAQTRIMTIGLILVLPAAIHTVVRAIHNPRERFLATLIVLIYLRIVWINVRRSMDVQIRGWILISLTDLFNPKNIDLAIIE